MKWAGGRSGRAAGVGGRVGEASRTVRRAKLGACWAARAAARACSAPGQHAPALCRQRCIPRRMWDPCTAPAAPAGGGRRPQRRPPRPAAAPRPPAPLCTLRRGAPVSSSPRSPRAWRAQSAGTPRPASAGRPGASCRAPSVRREGRGRGGGQREGARGEQRQRAAGRCGTSGGAARCGAAAANWRASRPHQGVLLSTQPPSVPCSPDGALASPLEASTFCCRRSCSSCWRRSWSCFFRRSRSLRAISRAAADSSSCRRGGEEGKRRGGLIMAKVEAARRSVPPQSACI